MSKLLLIDDDQELCELLVSWLTQEGFELDVCHEAQSARGALAEHQPEVVILDVMLPDGSGLELLRQLRASYPELPVLMLSARGEPLDRILGLELGADDYLSKPCDPRELTARLRAILRRTQPVSHNKPLEIGDLRYSAARGMAYIHDQEVSLTLTEGRILEALLAHPTEPIDKQALAEHALGRKLTLYDRSLDMHVSNLRRKLGPHADGRPRILALRGRGYMYQME